MANKIAIITDTGADMIDELEKIGVDYVSLYITFDGNNYIKQIKDVSVEEFYNKLENATFYPKTSLPSVMDFVDTFNKHIDNGEEVLYLALNSKFSGTYQAALSAKDLILEENKDAKITVIDTLNCTYMQYVLARTAKELADDGKSMDEIVDVMNKMIPTDRVIMTVDSLDNLNKSGRVSNASAFLGGLLGIKPILDFQDGVLQPTGKVKGLNKAFRTIIEEYKEFLGDNASDYDFAIVHGNHLDEAKEFGEEVKTELGIDKLDYCNLGVCIGLHAGPTLTGIACIKVRNL